MWSFVFVDEAEIEDWFLEEKQKLGEQLYKAAYAQKSIVTAKKSYDKAFAKLLKKYEKEHCALMRRRERKTKMRKPLDSFKKRRKEAKLRRRQKWEEFLSYLKKKKFEWEYSRLMKK